MPTIAISAAYHPSPQLEGQPLFDPLPVSLLSLTVTVPVADTNFIFIEALPQVNKSSPTIIIILLQCVTANFYHVVYIFIVSRKRCVYKYPSLYPANRQHKQDLTPLPCTVMTCILCSIDARSNIHIMLYNNYKHKLSPYNIFLTCSLKHQHGFATVQVIAKGNHYYFRDICIHYCHLLSGVCNIYRYGRPTFLLHPLSRYLSLSLSLALSLCVSVCVCVCGRARACV